MPLNADNYGHFTRTTLAFGDAVRRVKAELANRGFGVLCEIDVAKTLKEKLGVEQPPTLILGACNPEFAHRALSAEPGIALLLPCNVVVRQLDSGVEISAIDARAMTRFTGNSQLEELAGEVDAQLTAVVAAVPR
ncbi:MAG TPA: DUF302 domain-containing protein [Candidatus Acidoferrales bacterium]|nr:DUF302 domain-containing protein [Candidatus Acidoferrales bacterium]